MWYSPYGWPTLWFIVVYGWHQPYLRCTVAYRSYHGRPSPSLCPHPRTIHVPSAYPTEVLYSVDPCRPLRPTTGLQSTHQRGVAQDKWSCVRPRPCLAHGLVLLVLLFVQSGLQPYISPWLHDDFHVEPLYWGHPYVCRRHRHANDRVLISVRHRNMLFRWVFRCVRHRKAVCWKSCTTSTILVLGLQGVPRNFLPVRTPVPGYLVLSTTGYGGLLCGSLGPRTVGST